MRQVSRDQLITTVMFQIRATRSSLKKQLLSHNDGDRYMAEEIMAALIVDKGFIPFEVLTSAPLPPGEGDGIVVNGRSKVTRDAAASLPTTDPRSA